MRALRRFDPFDQIQGVAQRLTRFVGQRGPDERVGHGVERRPGGHPDLRVVEGAGGGFLAGHVVEAPDPVGDQLLPARVEAS